MSFAADVDAEGACSVCGDDYAECECPGPTQESDDGTPFEYRTDADGVLLARDPCENQKNGEKP